MPASSDGMHAAFGPGLREDSVRTGLALIAAAWLAASTYPAGAKGGPHGGGAGRQGKDAGEAARCALRATIDATCGCDSATNHGAHLRCVAHALRRLAGDGLLARRCKGAVRRAARSACGRPCSVACDVPVSACNAGTCANDVTAACAVESPPRPSGARPRAGRFVQLPAAVRGVGRRAAPSWAR